MVNVQVKAHVQAKAHMLTFLEILVILVVDSKQVNNPEINHLRRWHLKVKILVLLVSYHFPFQVTTALLRKLELRLLPKESFQVSFQRKGMQLSQRKHQVPLLQPQHSLVFQFHIYIGPHLTINQNKLFPFLAIVPL